MFDGLIDVLMGWLALAWCFLLEQLVSLAVAMIMLVSMIMPSVAVPTWLQQSVPFGHQAMVWVAFFMPVNIVLWAYMAYLLYETANFMVLVLYRSFMDLL